MPYPALGPEPSERLRSAIRHGLFTLFLAATLTQPVRAQSTAVTSGAVAIDESRLAAFGGYRGLGMIAENFVERLNKNPVLAPFFKDAEADRLAALLTEQFCAELGAGCRYTGKSMREVHQGMGITLAHFNALAEELQSAMSAVGVAQAAQRRLIARLAPMKREIVE
jgi:hemoglobin